MTVADIKSLSTEQKLHLMEVLWDDLRERFESASLSPRVKELLDGRRARVERGEVRLLDWDEIKPSLGKV